MPSEITAEEQKLSYAKYYDMDLAPIPQEKIDILERSPISPDKALKFEDRNIFLDLEVPGEEVGYCVMENGTGYVANKTFMPGVTPDMFMWWFAWHSVSSDLRYKIWDKDDHYYARALDPDYVKDPSVPVFEKTWGVTHKILEDIGMGPDDLLLHFKKPSDMGYQMEKIGTEGCAGMVCAVGEGNAPAVMTHKCRAVEGGIVMESRFWMGYGLMDGKLVPLVPPGKSIPDFLPKTLFSHNIKEFSNLAAILPSVYAEEKENW